MKSFLSKRFKSLNICPEISEFRRPCKVKNETFYNFQKCRIFKIRIAFYRILNGLTRLFPFFKQKFYRKKYRRIRTQVVGVEGEYARPLSNTTTTTTQIAFISFMLNLTKAAPPSLPPNCKKSFPLSLPSNVTYYIKKCRKRDLLKQAL